MLKPAATLQASSQGSSLFFSGRAPAAVGHHVLPPKAAQLLPSTTSASPRRRIARRLRICCAAEQSPAVMAAVTEDSVTVKAVVTVQLTISGIFAHLGLERGQDDIIDLLGKSLLLELVSAEVDPKTRSEKPTISTYAHRASQGVNEIKYEGDFSVPSNFGAVGAVLVENEHHKEMYLKNIVLMTGDATTAITINCQSWVHSKYDNPNKRIFFTNKSYLPSQTPSGLRRLRKKELELLRGDGTGERKIFERIYDYDTYNDLGDPDKSEDMARPVIGGSKELPYPRRCRTGRPRTRKDPQSEQRTNKNVYVPRDEAFSEVKQLQFSTKTLRSVLHAFVPVMESRISDRKLSFPCFTTIDSLFSVGVALPKQEGLNLFRAVIPRLVKALGPDEYLHFEAPAMIHKDKFSWFRDEEFSRQTLAGLNPSSIQLVTKLPLVSELDPDVYGPPESAITEELIEREIRGIMTVKEALEQRKLFMLDYHDVLIPFVHKVREQEGTTLYGSRALFFLTPDDTLRPIAIELTRPASAAMPQWRQVFTHRWDATGAWLWKLAKAHVCAHDSGYHQLVSHWLRAHACTEPYIIAANRQLSAMHPIYRLLHPHFRYTMEINALARQYLINAGGIIEDAFSPGKYAMEICSAAYAKFWRFDMEALPADLIRRGMAVEDPTAELGLRLTIKDYPFANDGLLIWTSIEQWVRDYVSHYYWGATDVAADEELQAWWTEVRTKGHPDKQDEPWWPELETRDDLVRVLTTIIWVASAHHAAVNFGQYHYAGYFPNRPTIARANMPVEDVGSAAYRRFLEKPEAALLECFPSQVQATVVMAILDILSCHAPDEEYLGGEAEPAWRKDPVIDAAFRRFATRMKEIEAVIDERNADPSLLNRCGAGVVPYELLKPFSQPGVTGMGIPNSISI